MRDPLLLVITFVCSLVAIWRPSSGVLAYVGYAVLAPQSHTWFYSRDFPHSKFIVAGIIIGYLLSSEAKRFPRQRESLLILALWALFGLSTLFALRPELALNQFIEISKIFLMFFLTTSLINTEDRIQLLLKVIALGLGLYGAKIGIFVLRTGGVSTVFGPQNTYLYANNSIGMALAMNVPLLFYISQRETRKWLRWSMRIMMALSYPAVAGTFSRGDWIGLGVITALMLIKSKRKVLTFTAWSILAFVTVAWLPEIVSPQMSRRYDILVDYEQDESAESRLWNWEFCKRVGVERPLTGGGFKFFSLDAYAKYYPEFQQRWPGKVWSCHNTFLLVLSEHGFPAFLLWIALLISCFMSLGAIRLFGRTHSEMSWLTDYADMLQIAFIGFVIMGIFVDFAYYEIFYQFVAVIVVIKQKIAQKATEPAATPLVARKRSVLVKT